MTVTPVAPALPANQVRSRARRGIGYAMFADLLPGVRFDWVEVAGSRKRTIVVTFDRDLIPEEAQAVADRLESTDDDDLADRAALRTLIAAVEAMEPTPTRQLIVRVARRTLDA